MGLKSGLKSNITGIRNSFTNFGNFSAAVGGFGTNVTGVTGKYMIFGNFVVINMNVILADTAPSGTQLLKRLSSGQPAINGVSCVLHQDGTTNNSICYVDFFGGNDGTCVVTTESMPAGSYRGMLLYFKN